MNGFFNKSEVQDLAKTRGRSLSCFSCGLSRGLKSPKMEPWGNFKKYIMIIGDHPSKKDDRNGKPWQDEAGVLLEQTLEKLGIDLFEDCISLNAVNCSTPKDTAPNAHEINCCREVKVVNAIKEYDPNVIILLGNSALLSLISHRWRKKLGPIQRWRGFTIPDKDFKAWICPTFHPKYVIETEKKETKVIWKQDLKEAIALVDVKRPRYKKVKINYITDLSPLNEIKSGLIAFDYETTGLKPHAKGQRIICASVAVDESNVFVFEIPKKKSERLPFINLLKNPNVDKIASNLKYEDTWSVVRLGVQVKGWCWDTMLAAHVLDNRAYISGLKFQAYINMGVMDYDSDVAEYLEAREKGGNEINRISELLAKPGGLKTVLTYCAYDSIYEFRLALLQMNKLGNDWLPF